MLNLSIVRHFFLPHVTNNQKPKILHSSVLFLISAWLLIFQFLIQAAPKAGVSILGYAANIPAEEVVRLTNEKRVANGLPPLEFNPNLAQAAKSKGEHMLNNDYWAHVAPDGTEPWKFFSDIGYRYRYAGENLARDFSDSTSAVDAWMASPTHRDNLMSEKYKDIGIAVVEGDMAGVDTTIIVQFFGTKYADSVPTLPVAANTVQAQSQKSSSVEKPKVNLVSPTPSATPTPTPYEFETKTAALVSSQIPPSKKVLVSPFIVTRSMSFAIVGLLLGVFMLDAYLTTKRRIVRIGGRSFAHIAYLGMILAISLILRSGSIL